MSALDLFATVKARGLGVRYDPLDGAVVILSHGPAPEDVVKAVRAAKPQLVAFLKPDETGATGLDYWRVFNRVLADATARGEEPEIGRISAFESTLAERLKHDFDARGPPDDPTRCIHCGGGEANGDLLLPTGSNAKGWRAWLHNRCSGPWREKRQKRALAALATLGIEPPIGWLAAKLERDANEARAAAAWRNVPFHFIVDDDSTALVDWARREFFELKQQGFRAWLDDNGSLFVGDDTPEHRRAPGHVWLGLSRLARALDVDPGLIDSVWPPEGEAE